MNRTIRRILAITLILVMAMSLVACGNTNGPTTGLRRPTPTAL